MPQDYETTRSGGFLRVTLKEPDIQDLMAQFPKLSRTEISDAISRRGPMRNDVERELTLLSSRKS